MVPVCEGQERRSQRSKRNEIVNSCKVVSELVVKKEYKHQQNNSASLTINQLLMLNKCNHIYLHGPTYIYTNTHLYTLRYTLKHTHTPMHPILTHMEVQHIKLPISPRHYPRLHVVPCSAPLISHQILLVIDKENCQGDLVDSSLYTIHYNTLIYSLYYIQCIRQYTIQ